jgi:hypothetical protein
MGDQRRLVAVANGTVIAMTSDVDVVVPALALRGPDGEVDYDATRRYAQRASHTWVDSFILSGSTTRGGDLTASERARVVDLWLAITESRRLLACCWEPADIVEAQERGVAPMVVMAGLDGLDAAVAFLRGLPTGAYIYSHPIFGGAVFDATVAEAARREGVLPAGGKLAKITMAGVAKLRRATGDGFKLWDGSSRRITASIAAGASGVVATPLCPFDMPLAAKEPFALQAVIDPVQVALDALPDRGANRRIAAAGDQGHGGRPGWLVSRTRFRPRPPLRRGRICLRPAHANAIAWKR